jgi:hypothetical protein
VKPGDWRFRFWDQDNGKDVLTTAAVISALVLGIVKSRIALAVGGWMAKVQR